MAMHGRQPLLQEVGVQIKARPLLLVDVIKKRGNVDGVGTSWSVILGVLLVAVVVHGQGLRYSQESVYCMRSIGG